MGTNMSDAEIRMQCLAAAIQLGACLGLEVSEAQRIYNWVTGTNRAAVGIAGGGLAAGQLGAEYVKAQNFRG